MNNYDVVVIGGGLGGYPAAIELARNNYRVALIEAHRLGGECTNYGCIPTKALVRYAASLHEANRIPGLEVRAKSYEEMTKWRDSVIERLSDGIAFLLEKYGVEVINGYGRLKSPYGEVEVTGTNGKTEIRAGKILLATGTSPLVPKGFQVDGIRVHDNRSILKLRRKPRSLLIIGGGAIGVEYANAYALLGTDVTIVELMPTILPGMDKECIRWAKTNLKRLGVKIYTNTYITSLKPEERCVVASTSREMSISAEHALIATGRKPETGLLGLERAGVKTDPKGFVIVDERLRTTNPKIYAAGDIAGPPLLAHKAYMQSLTAAANIMGGKKKWKKLIPFVVFTVPEIACVGMTEDEARKRKIPYKTAKFYYTALSRAHIESDGEGIIKILYDEKTHKLLGAHMYGPGSGDIISEITLAMENGITLDKLADTVHPHPTMSEAVREASELALGRPIHLYLKRKE